jgi:hypothetical protein
MRSIVSLVVALCLTVAGGGGLAYLILFAPGFYGWMMTATALVFGAGLMWLYADLTEPTPSEDL